MNWILMSLFCFSTAAFAEPNEFSMPADWQSLRPILVSRVHQHNPKMKLSAKEAKDFVNFLNTFHKPTPKLLQLQKVLPKTTLELLMAVCKRGLSLIEAEKMAEYLDVMLQDNHFKYPQKFDENTSHIIGREWNEIDYSGENMTWQKQRLKYLPYGVVNFKSLDSLKKFFEIESTLPYFKKNYQPQKFNINVPAATS